MQVDLLGITCEFTSNNSHAADFRGAKDLGKPLQSESQNFATNNENVHGPMFPAWQLGSIPFGTGVPGGGVGAIPQGTFWKSKNSDKSG
jgi:hypothetical protein